jgi:hypothetical protein
VGTFSGARVDTIVVSKRLIDYDFGDKAGF